MSRDYHAALQRPVARVDDKIVSNHECNVRLNPYNPQPGKILPEGFRRNPQGYLLRPSLAVPLSTFDTNFLEQEVHHLRNYVVIISFIEGAPTLHSKWLHELQDTIVPGRITLHKEVGWGFCYILLDSELTTRKVLALTPHKFSVETALFQSWIPGFDPRKPEGLHIPVWITLHLLPLQFMEYAKTVASYVGRVIEEDKKVTITQDPRFCVELEVDRGWISTLQLPIPDGRTIPVGVEYDNEAVNYSQCFDWNHHRRDCTALPYRTRVAHTNHSQSNNRSGRNLGPGPSSRARFQSRRGLEEGGFTIVENRRNRMPHHHARYWRPVRGGHRQRNSNTTVDMEMTESHSEESSTPVPRPLPSQPRSPTPQPPSSIHINDNLAKEIEAMEVEFPNITELANAELLSIESGTTASGTPARPAVLQNPCVVPLELEIPNTQSSRALQLISPNTVAVESTQLTLEMLGISQQPQPRNIVYFHPSTTETSDPIDEDFEDAQAL
jgi:hypothetical protein